PAPLKKGGARASQSPPYMKTFFLWPPPYQGGREGVPQGDQRGSRRGVPHGFNNRYKGHHK
ncbi:MAG: hypothetical protein SXA11_24460, partial [Cyanobacteriota bacterium]|nr:hypothetical protein [Cyanobacteriota bacterium]